jgi:hypothetical protein
MYYLRASEFIAVVTIKNLYLSWLGFNINRPLAILTQLYITSSTQQVLNMFNISYTVSILIKFQTTI